MYVIYIYIYTFPCAGRHGGGGRGGAVRGGRGRRGRHRRGLSYVAHKCVCVYMYICINDHYHCYYHTDKTHMDGAQVHELERE